MSTGTPSKAKTASSGLQSIPNNSGSACYASYETEHSREVYRPYLAADIAHTLEVPFDDFLRTAFDLPDNLEDDPQLVRITKTSTFLKLLEKYTAMVDKEIDCYLAFNALANHIIAELGKESSLVFRCNDPLLGRGSRKPNCVVVRPSALEIGGRGSWDNLSKVGPGNDKVNAFDWHEILAFWEFRLKEPDSRSCLSVSSTVATSSTSGSTSSSSLRRAQSLKGKEKDSSSKATRFPPHMPEKRTASGASSLIFIVN